MTKSLPGRPPRGRPFGTVLTYGRYEGWSLGTLGFVVFAYLVITATSKGSALRGPSQRTGVPHASIQ